MLYEATAMANKNGSSSGSDNGDSHNSSVSSVSEEEQLRRLFNSCDADGDGYLDGEDLRFMCRMLNMSDSVEEVRIQLGLTEMSRISFQDFLHCRARVMLHSNTNTGTRYPMSPKHVGAGVVVGGAGGSGEDTGVDSDAAGTGGVVGNSGNVVVAAATGHQLTSWPTLSSDSL
ncbi:hypothetical protein EGW08_010653, partial [Elysia chlorotica]